VSYRIILDDVEWIKASSAGVKIYPQPARDRVTIEAELERTVSVTITLSDMSGRELLRVNGGRASGHYRREISMGHLPAGTYLVRLELGDKRVVEKIVKGD